MSTAVRRVVTGLDEQGRSTVLFDDRVALGHTTVLWHTDAVPADNSGREDSAGDFTFDLLRSPGTSLMVTRLEPGQTADGPLMHATDTIDYLVVLQGQVALSLEAGSVTLGPGDFIVDRGVVHGWQVVGDETLMMATVVIPAVPVGAGATI